MKLCLPTSRLALAVIGALAFTACSSTESDTTSNRTTERTTPSTTTTSSSTTTESAPRTVARPAETRASGTQVAGGMSKVTLAYPTGDASTSAVLLEKTAPTEVRVGQAYDYVITVKNISRLDLQDVLVIEQPGNGFALASSEPAAQRGADNRLQFPLGSMRAGETKTIRATGSATGVGSVVACTEVVYNSRACVETIVVQPNLALTKTAPEKILQCDPVTLTYVVTNPGSGVARNVKINDPLPDGWTTDTGAGDVMIDVGNLNAGQSIERKVVVKAAGRGRMGSAGTATADGNLTAASPRTETTVCMPVLAVEKKGPEMRFAGRPIEYEITVKNTGDGEAKDTILEDAIPAGTTFVSASAGGTVSANKVVWNLGTIAAGAEKKVNLVLTAQSAGVVRNTATARAYCAAAASGTADTTTSGIPAILLEVIDVEDPVEVGGNITYIITVTNQGSAPGTNIVIACELERQLTVVSASGDTRAPANVATTRTFRFEPLPTLAPKAKATWRVVAKAEDAADVRFKVILNSNEISRPVEETESTNLYR